MPSKPQNKASASATTELVGFVGLVIVTWQQVEEAHYLLFAKLVGVPSDDIASILYFSPPTFESRRVLVDRIAQCTLENKAHKSEWAALNKRLGKGASNRGKIAHYSLYHLSDIRETGDPDSPIEFVSNLEFPLLTPSIFNRVAALKGEGKNVTVRRCMLPMSASAPR